MSELYLVNSQGSITDIEKVPFQNEVNDLENFILNNERILGNIIILNRQIEIPNGLRIDLWGIDILDKRAIIIELKNVIVGLEIIPQILPYHQFLKQNPDTLKYKALTDQRFIEKAKYLERDANEILNQLDSDPKVIIIAPGYKNDLATTIDYLNIDVDLYKIARYKLDAQNMVIHVDKPDYSEAKANKVRVMEAYTWDKYETLGIKKRKIEECKKLFDLLSDIIRDENLALEPVFRKLYIPFQFNYSNIFWIDLSYTSYDKGEPYLVFKLLNSPQDYNFGIPEKIKFNWKNQQLGIFYNGLISREIIKTILVKSYEESTGAKEKRANQIL